ncbi:hypothetical protein GCM10010969_09330 [Saccharibacillus kuerlensis]|uniref:Uncharacterized protein n=1 Tax=Saccharibacillus kuerlensis TaxID=459527 RepID=A0ABQ2KW04_9BACL|nr:hypothetical protein GCM10010969_09330 [Saccharibacillus kuerlensis]
MKGKRIDEKNNENGKSEKIPGKKTSGACHFPQRNADDVGLQFGSESCRTNNQYNGFDNDSCTSGGACIDGLDRVGKLEWADGGRLG